MTLKGRIVVLAGKSVEVEFDAGSLGVYESVPFFDVKRVHEGGVIKQQSFIIGERSPESVIPAPSTENNDPVRRKPGRPKKAA